MDDLAAEIGTSKSILYRYFTDKTGLQSAVGEAVLANLREELEAAGRSAADPRARLAAMVGVYLEMVEASSHVYTFVTRPEAVAAAGALQGFVAEVEDMVGELLLPVLRHGTSGDALAAGSAEERALAQLWGAGLVGLVRAIAERWSGHRDGERTGDRAVDGAVARLDHHPQTEQITDWLWEGAAATAHHAPEPRPATTRPEPS